MLLVGDSREWLPKLKDNLIAAIVTDPPYELGFQCIGIESAEKYIPLIQKRCGEGLQIRRLKLTLAEMREMS